MMFSPTLMPALVTPFTRVGGVSESSHTHNLTFLADRGIGGFLLAGSTGEGPLLDPGERHLLTSTARRVLGRRTTLLVGVAAESVRQATRQVEEASDADADGVLVTTPTTIARRSIEAQRRFYTAVADASPLPVLLYSVPNNTGYHLDEALAIELSGHPNIVGMKDSGGDAGRIQRIVSDSTDAFQVFNGASRSISLAVTGGAYGAITASANFIPGLVADLVRTARRSPTKAMELQPRVTSLSAAIESHGIGGIKVAATALGLQAGLPRAPLPTVTGSTARAIRERIRSI